MNEFLKKSIRIYSYLGIWPLGGSSMILEKLRYAFGIILVISIAVFNALQYVDIFLQWGQWESFIENAPLSFLTTLVFFKIYVIYSRRKEIVSLSEDVDTYVNELFLEKNDKKITLLRNYEKRVGNINNFLFFASVVCLAFSNIWPILTIFLSGDYSLRPFTVRVYFPFTLNATGNYVAAYLSVVVIGFVTGIHTIVFDAFFIGCILFAIARIRIFQYSIARVNIVARKKKLGTNTKDYFTQTASFEENFRRNTGIELKRHVEEHQKIIAFCKIIDSMLSLNLFVVFFSYGVIICFLGFFATLLGPNMKLLKLGQILSVLLSQIFFYFWYGSELTTESLKVADSLLKNDWYSFEKNNIKTIMIVIFRSQNPILLNVGKFYPVTLQTFVSLLKTSYSYFALLKQFYD